MLKRVIALLASISGAAISMAQTTIQPRQFERNAETFAAAAVYGESSTRSRLHVVTISAGTVQSTSVQTAVDLPGDVVVLQNNAAIIASGTTSTGQGIIDFLAPNGSGGFVSSGTLSIPGGALVGVCYSPTNSVLYILDAGNQKLLKAAYSAGGAVPTTTVEVANPTSFPGLADVWSHRILLEEDGVEPAFLVVPFATERQYNDVQINALDYFRVADKSGGFVAETILPGNGEFLFGIDTTKLDVGQNSVPVFGVPGYTVNIVEADRSNAVVGTGIVGPTGTGSVAVSALQYGTVYVLKSPASSFAPTPSPPFLTPSVFIGIKDPLDFGAEFRGWESDIGLDAHIGNAYFSISMPVDPDSSIAPPGTQWSAALLLGAATDLQQVGGRTVIVGNVMFTDVRLPENDFPGVLNTNFPLPLFEPLIGLEIFVQYVVQVAPGDLRYSDIASISIRGLPFVPEGSEDFFRIDVELLDSLLSEQGGQLGQSSSASGGESAGSSLNASHMVEALVRYNGGVRIGGFR